MEFISKESKWVTVNCPHKWVIPKTWENPKKESKWLKFKFSDLSGSWMEANEQLIHQYLSTLELIYLNYYHPAIKSINTFTILKRQYTKLCSVQKYNTYLVMRPANG